MKRSVYAYAFLVISAVAAPTFAAAQHVASSGTVHTNWETTGTLWESGTYAYDAAGNVKQIGGDRYAYDQYGRLVSATANTPSSPNAQAFTYDRYGNLKSMTTTSASGTFRGAFAVVPSTNRLDGTCEQPYDVCHSRLHNPDTGAETGRYTAGEYQWDALGMLEELNGDRHERHLYDANDERIVTIQYTGNVEMTRRYSLRAADNKVLRELTLNVPANSWTVDRDYVHRGSTLMAAFTGTDAHPTRHYHPDHLGTPRVVTDADGYRLNIHTYLPFGREAEGSEPDTERLKFTGHERDSSGPASPGFDLDYMHARFYDPNVGRFSSVDPTWDSADLGKPQSWNRYSYVLNNPVNAVDPDGRLGFLTNDPEKLRQRNAKIIGYTSKAIAVIVLDADSTGASADRLTPEQLRAAARARADQAQAEGKKGGAATAYQSTDGKVHTGVSGSRTPHAPGIQEVVDSVPEGERSAFHGKCSECNAFSNAERAGSPTTGGRAATVNIAKPGSPLHGMLKAPCSTCNAVMKLLKIIF